MSNLCGICGIVDFQNIDQAFKQKTIKRMCDSMSHRGPDEEGTYLDGNVGLGSRRLSIIDLATGHQPITNEDKSIWVVQNGETYNYRELMKNLQTMGHNFTTVSDTEVIVHAYEEYGIDCVHKFIGMFAFALWDRKRRQLFIVRDRLGIKPLYYYLDDKRLIFASEIKGILADTSIPREIDYKGLNNFFTFGHSVAPNTIYQGIKKLLPGHYLLCRDGKVEIKEYWDLHYSPSQGLLSEEEYAKRAYELLQDSVRLQLVSDVPLGTFLSGGIDSSAVVGLMSTLMDQPVKTFSVGFESGGGYNELPDARLVAEYFGTDHHELKVKPGHLVEVLQKLVYHYDEPFGDAASFPTHLVSKFAREYVKVVLTGEGGDELFGGYRRYSVERWSEFYQRIPTYLREIVISKAVKTLPRFRRVKKAVNSMSIPAPDLRYGSWLTVFSDEMKMELFSAEVARLTEEFDSFEIYRQYYNKDGIPDLLSRMMYTDIKTWLPDTYLEKVDKASMAVGLEARVPFLDHRLVEFAFGIPSKYKIRGLMTKYILKRAMKGLLPESVLRKRKHGFAVPTDPWFRGELKDFAFDVLTDARTRSRGYFNPRYIEKLWKLHHSGKEVYDTHLWLLLNFELWHRIFMDGERRTV